MKLLILWAALAPQGLQIDGLAAGERFEWLAPPVYEDAEVELWQDGRVVDARSGLPIAGAVLDAWTEEISERGPGFRRVGETTTGADGLFRLRVQEGALRGDKVRVRASGYLTRSCTDSDLGEPVLLMPAPAQPARLKIVDLMDRPIADARITTTASCAHDLPAFEARTDGLGIALLPEWGLQESTPELRVRAAGYNALEYLDEDEVLLDAQALVDGTIPTVRLARQLGLRVRLVPPATDPIRIVDGEGEHVVFPSVDGRFEILSRYVSGEISVSRLADGVHLFSGSLPAQREIALRSTDEGERPPPASVVLELDPAPAAGTQLPVALFHPEGWSLAHDVDASSTRLEFHAGEGVLLAIGGAFSGYEQELRELSLAPGETRVRIAARRELELTLHAPPQPYSRAVVEAVGSVEVPLDATGTARVRVPAGRPVVALIESAAGPAQRVGLPPLDVDTTVDFRASLAFLPLSQRQRILARPRSSLEVSARLATGSALVGELTARGLGEPQVEELGGGRWRVGAPAGAPLLLHHRAGGHADVWVQVHAPLEGAAAQPVELAPTALAALRFEGAERWTIEGPLAESLDAIHPGPLTLVLRDATGHRIALSLRLQPGESRTLRLRAGE
jgi:hypothetical protein